MFYPDSFFKSYWDLLITLMLVFSCTIIPYRIAFIVKEDSNWEVLQIIIDLFFFVDIIFSFNTAFMSEDLKLIESRKVIAKDYLKGWFAIDVIAIIPFDFMISGGDQYN